MTFVQPFNKFYQVFDAAAYIKSKSSFVITLLLNTIDNKNCWQFQQRTEYYN